jgi:hypothetical protein
MNYRLLIPVIALALAAAIYLLAVTGDDEKPEDHTGELFDIAARTVSPDLNSLSVKFILPPHMKFVPEALPEVSATSGDPRIISLTDTENSDPERAYTFPIQTSPGETVISIDYRVFYCEDGPGAVCFTRLGRIRVPVIVSVDGDDSLDIRHHVGGR